jgi:isoquinoline 1-oxidoreductase
MLSDTALRAELSRRTFLRIVGGGIVVALITGEVAPGRAQTGRRRFGGQLPREIGAWLHIGRDSAISVYTGKVELGQNIRTSLTQVVAEELHVAAGRIRVVMADTELTPFDMGTFGSMTTPVMASQLRRVAAAARELLLDLAADRGRAARNTLRVADGRVVGPNGKPALAFGELTRGEKIVKLIADTVPTTPAAKWAVAGTSMAKVDGRTFVTGSHRYAADIRRPGMLFGKVLRPPSFKAVLANVRTTGAETPGVTVVREGDFVGVAAATEHAASRALAVIRADWKTVDDQPSSEDLFKYLKSHPGKARGGFGGGGGNVRGSIKKGLQDADHKLEATYTLPYIAHAPLEPRAAVAEWEGKKLTVWTGTQRPFGVRDELARALNVPAQQIRVIVPDTGSGYGGKHTGEAAVEAARLARAAKKPVKVLWTREEEFTWAYFRPAGIIEVNAGVKRDGTLTAWEFHNYNSGASAIRTPYEVPNQRVVFHAADSPLRQGSYRALAATANHFAREVHMDALAQALRMDPLTFRLRNLKDPRLRAVLEGAAQRFGWGKAKPPAGHGFGIAGGTEKGSYVATCAEVGVERGRPKVIRVVTAFECGAVLNPDHLKNQVEGAVIMGLGGALFETIQFAHGRILNPRFSRYRVPRFVDTPALETVLLDRKDLASAGAGETPIVALAPAVANAIFNATGERLHSLPLMPGKGA